MSDVMIRDYDAAVTYLRRARDEAAGRLLPGAATRLVWVERDGVRCPAVRYHETPVVTWCPNGDVVLDSGGWRTVTTRARIDAYLPAGWGLYADRGVWWLCEGVYWSDPAQKHAFADGITIRGEGGTVVGAAPAVDLKARAAERKAIAAYVTNYMAALTAGDVPPPGPGDCWFCLLALKPEGATRSDLPRGGAPRWGELRHRADDPGHHLRAHLDEDYYVPSLLLRALEVMGAGPIHQDAVLWYMHGQPAGHGYAERWTAPLLRDAARMLRRYMLRELGHQA